MENESFHFFPALPPEIRHAIWSLCLPRRTAEVDFADFLFDGENNHQACWRAFQRLKTIMPPVIASVSREARRIALQQGGRLEPEKSMGMESIWVQPRLDVLHFNWTRAPWHDDASYPVDDFLIMAHDLRMQPSIVAEVLHPFDLGALPDGEAASDSPLCDFNAGVISFNSRLDVYQIADYADEMATSGYAYLRARAQDNLSPDVFRLVSDSGHRRTGYQDLSPDAQKLNVTMAGISLHITREAAARSGLFGLLGDAPVQMIDFDDVARLAEYHALFKENAADKHEPTVQRLFEILQTARFREAVELWKRQADWLYLAYAWARNWEKDDSGPLMTDRNSGWFLCQRGWAGWFAVSMKCIEPDYEHEWVKQARKKAYKPCPQIMVRFCTEKCYFQEGIPSSSDDLDS